MEIGLQHINLGGGLNSAPNTRRDAPAFSIYPYASEFCSCVSFLTLTSEGKALTMKSNKGASVIYVANGAA